MATQVARFVSIDPATEEEIEAFDIARESDVDRVLEAAARAWRDWRWRPIGERATVLHAVAATLRREAEVHAATITAEMGKPLHEARAEVEKCAFCCDYFADEAPRLLADERAPSDSPASFVSFDPLGTLLACMPWNFPYWQVFRCIAPALMAGNCVVLKHASNTTRCGLRIEQALHEAGVPGGVFAMLVLPNDRVADVIADSRVAAVSLTGSTAAGRSVATAAGQHVKKCVLELGGSDAFIVLADADVAVAAETGVRSRFQNAGQSCISAKRFIVHDAVADEFEDRLIQLSGELRVGDPKDAATQIGPLARADLRDTLVRQLRESVGRGARLRAGGDRVGDRGFYLQPAVLTGCAPGMPAFDEETFGPLASVTRVGNDDEAVIMANHSEYGLGGNVWTRDLERGIALAHRLDTGGVFVNGMTHSDPRIPFGGVRGSGYGRELHRFGIQEFVDIKTIWLPPA
ncbi:MAG: NAD-dependent succinate-semialdehyde dehydrogenase [Candidatus Dormibacteraeota bacterium]|nr:NAD-dependent succinate-semialdehyde dehydrogenase [Candidatus Dormibacteraeota bacterium]